MRIGSFNINGVRDQNKRVKLSEFMKIGELILLCYKRLIVIGLMRVGLMVGGKICTQSWF